MDRDLRTIKKSFYDMDIVLNLLDHELKPKKDEVQKFYEYSNGTIKFENVSLEQSHE